MTSIDAISPFDPDPTATLWQHDADELARYVADPANEWFRRQACALALAGRVPEEHVPALIARIQDVEEDAEVRVPLLEALGDRAELLPWLRQPERKEEDDDFGLHEAFLKARGRLGDRTATGDLAVRAAEPRDVQRGAGEAGLNALADRCGLPAVLEDLGEARPEDRLARDLLRHRAGQDITASLADPDRMVAHHAYLLATDPARLRAYLAGRPPVEAALWAVCALHRLTGDAEETADRYARLGRPRVDVPGLPEQMRRAIVHEYAAASERGTDPRWRLEAICGEPPAPVDVEGQLRRSIEALGGAGIAFEAPVDAFEHHGIGSGTYHAIRLGEGGTVRVSTLGPFVGTLGEWDRTLDDDSPARTALERAGFHWVERATANLIVTDLCVYWFGRRLPLNVDTLLYFWQD
ncbi:hypothetical protein [Kitasatospora sp. NPDC058190]|uniref:hypothetical protein n=1 Tax=Kitasatospora sp. NPDC058190 TaxID=3346371 RepID=UPI0036DBD497